MALIPGAENINLGAYVPNIMYWVGYIFAGIVLIGAMGAVFYYMSFPIKANIFQIYGSGKDGVFAFSKRTTNRVRWNNKKTGWQPMFPLFNKKQIQPFDSEYMYPGKQIYVFELNGEWMPGRINVTQGEDQLRCEINPVPYTVREWQSIEYKRNAIEYAEHNFWNDNRSLVVFLLCAVIIIAGAVATVWLTYKLAGAGSKDISSLVKALGDVGQIKGVAPQ